MPEQARELLSSKDKSSLKLRMALHFIYLQSFVLCLGRTPGLVWGGDKNEPENDSEDRF